MTSLGLAVLIGVIVFVATASLLWALIAFVVALVILGAPGGYYGSRYRGPRW